MNLRERFKGWTLFLDRDGVINQKLKDDYVKNWDEFQFCENSLLALSKLSKIFNLIIIVTNQRGVGKGVLTETQLNSIHKQMLIEIVNTSGRIDKIYFCPEIDDNSECRKPNLGMAKRAKKDFNEINFFKSIIVGDSITDMEFGSKLSMKRVFIAQDKAYIKNEISSLYDFCCYSLYEFSQKLDLFSFEIFEKFDDN